jgi:rhomboid protease GluP
VEPSAGSDEQRLVTSQGPLTRDQALLLLDRGAELLEAGDFNGAFAHYRRVIGFDDPAITAAALLGSGQARFRIDDEAGAVASWEAILELPETASTYPAYRELAAARVRDGDLQGAIAAYREADRRAPPEDKAEIATRLGWLAKETGNVRASRRYFARGRGAVMPFVTYGLMAVTVAVSVTSFLTAQPGQFSDIDVALALAKPEVANGELWRLWTVTLVHADILHLAFNMYALWLVGPVVEQIYGPIRMFVVYFLSALGGSVASFAFNDGPLAVGASGAIFGLFGILFVASRMHLPMLDRRGRAIIGQVGALILINIIIGFGVASIDNLAHLGGLVTGALMGIVFKPSGVETLSSRWQPGTNRPVLSGFLGTPAATLVAIGVLIAGIGAGLWIGLERWADVPSLFAQAGGAVTGWALVAILGTIGSTTLTRAPRGERFSAWASPPWARASSSTMASPRPEPCPAREGSPR